MPKQVKTRRFFLFGFSKLEKKTALLVICLLCLSITVTQLSLVHATISTLPQLLSPQDQTVVLVGPVTFTWSQAAVSAGDSIIEQQVQTRSGNGPWGYILFEPNGSDTQYTLPASSIQSAISVGLDSEQWRVYVVGLYDSIYGDLSPQTWTFNILKTPYPWVDSNSWAFSLSYSGGQIQPMNYQTFLQDRQTFTSSKSGYWWPLNSSIGEIYVTSSSQPTLCWTNWQSDGQLTPVDFATSYRVQVSASQDFSSTVVDATTQSNSYVPSSLNPGVYYWRVNAQNGNLATAWSPTEAFIIAQGPTPTTSPSASPTPSPSAAATDAPSPTPTSTTDSSSSPLPSVPEFSNKVFASALLAAASCTIVATLAVRKRNPKRTGAVNSGA